MGQFDQAIACWHRVEEVKPGDKEAGEEISRLTVEKAVHHGGYDRKVISGKDETAGRDSGGRSKQAAEKGGDRAAAAGEPPPKLSREQFLRNKIESDPSEVENYVEVAKLHEGRQDFEAAHKVLEQALAAAGGGDLTIRQHIEDLQMRHGQHRLAVAQKRAASEPSDDSADLVRRLKAQTNQQELEIYGARAERDPKNATWKHEMGVRLKLAGKFRQAIEVLQDAMKDARTKPAALLETGECFQHLEEYDLALSRYREAVEACKKDGTETKKRALYRAGVLATGLRELDQAEAFFKELTEIDPEYRDVSARLDKVARLRDKE
jgi:tetratricopeptide (TPR) repeat protein